MAIYKTQPIFDKTIWGRSFLSKFKGNTESSIGTTWEISFHDYGSNFVESENKTLSELISENPSMLGSTPKEELLRIAYLDAKDNLSIQLHPTNDYASKYLSDKGKYEAWYIIEAKPGATIVVGTTTSDVELIKEALQNNTFERYLHKVPVQADDFVYIPAGLVHALGKDIFAIEVSTSSNTTYRFYDYGRQNRELHLKESFDNLDTSLYPIWSRVKESDGQTTVISRLCHNEFFVVDMIDVVNNYTVFGKNQLLYLSIFSENIEINGQLVQKYDSFLVDAHTESFVLTGNGKVLVSRSRDLDEIK